MWNFMVLRGLCPGNTAVQQAFKSKGLFFLQLYKQLFSRHVLRRQRYKGKSRWQKKLSFR